MPTAFRFPSRKFQPPPGPPGHVRRARLHAALAAGRAPHALVTAVSAEAGFGKTTLLAGYAREQEGPVAWVGFEPLDADPVRFWALLAEALARTGVPVGPDVLELARTTSAPAAQAEALATGLAEAMAACEAGGLLVLDDVHALGEHPALVAGLTALVSASPESWQVLLAGRVLPPLPWALYEARRQVARVGAGALRFTEAEIAELGEAATGRPLDPATLTALGASTDGWAALLWLALGSGALPGETDPQALAAYLKAEVLAPLSPDAAALAADLARLPSWPAAALGRAGLGPALGTLRERQWLVPRGADGLALWEPLRAMLAPAPEAPAERRPALAALRRAIAEEDAEGALTLALAAGDADAAREDAERVGTDLLACAERERLALWLPRLAPLAPVEAAFYRGEVARAQGRLEQAGAAFAEAERLASERGETDRADRARVFAAATAVMAASPEAGARLAAIREAPPSRDARTRGLAALTEGARHLMAQAAPEAAIAAFEAARAAYREAGDPEGEAKALGNLGLLHTRLGRFALAIDAYAAASAAMLSAGRLPPPMIDANLASIAYYEGRLAEGEAHAAAALHRAHRLLSPRDVRYATIAAGLVKLDHGRDPGRREAAEALFQAARAAALAAGDAGMAALAGAALAESALAAGELERAGALLAAAREGVPGLAPGEPGAGDLDFLAAQIAGARGELAAALGELERLEARFADQQAGFRLAQVRAEQAVLTARLACAPGSGAPEAARAAKALKLAEAAAQAGGYAHLLERLRGRLAAPEAEPEPPAPEAAPSADTAGLEVRAFGTFSLTRGGTPVSKGEWKGYKPKLILAYLLAHPEGATKEALTGLLYGDEDCSRTAVLVLISRLRQALEPGAGKGTPSRLVCFEGERYRLVEAVPLRYDVRLFEEALARARRPEAGRSARLEAYRAAVSTYRGPFLGDLDAADAWVLIERERLHALADAAHRERLALLAAGPAPEAELAEAAGDYLGFDPCAEAAHQLLMRLHLDRGAPEQALRQAEVLKETLWRTLAVPPSEASERLIAEAEARARAPR